jgi:hypothetical protein
MERAALTSPGSADIATIRGVCLVHAGRYDGATSWLTLGAGLDPFQSALEVLGMAHFLKHSFREATAEFEKIVDAPSWIHAFIAACNAKPGAGDGIRTHDPNLGKRDIVTLQYFAAVTATIRNCTGFQKECCPNHSEWKRGTG